jgi:hypothetical protein
MGPTNSEVEQTANNHTVTKDEENAIANTTDLSPDKDPEVTFDTGLRSWLQVLGSFFLFFNSWYVPLSKKEFPA